MLRKHKFFSLCVIFIGVLSIFIGIYRNEISTVFIKSVNICLECIGIG